MSTEETKSKQSDEDLLHEIRTRFSEFQLFWSANFQKGDDDITALGENGPMEKEKELRATEKRPFVHQDIISQYNRRIKNQSRLNARGIKVNPAGENANTETADRRENRIRQIDYECQAKHARQTALDLAVDRGFGFYCIYTEEADLNSFGQKIVIRPIANPKNVLVWPYCKQADRSDQEATFVLERYSWSIFRQKWPKAQKQSFADDMMSSGWGNNKEEAQVASYWKREFKRRKLLLLEYLDKETGEPIQNKAFEDELQGDIPKGVSIKRESVKDFPTVMQYMTNGFEILSRNKWIGTTIPIIMVAGPEHFDKDGKLVIESATRKAISAQITYDYALMNQIEKIAQIPKTKILLAEGSQDTATDWENFNKIPTAYGTYKHQIDGIPVPPPIIVEWTANVGEMETMKQSAMVAIENAYGISSIQHQDKVAKSGKALKELAQTADVTNYHFQESSDRALEYEGRVKNEILEKVEDQDAWRGFRKADDQYSNERVTPMENPETGEVQHPYGTSDDHSVVVEAGPDWASQWEKVSDSLDELAKNEVVFPLIADLWIQTKRLGPKGDKMAERFQKALLPPQLQESDQKLDPQMLLGELQKAQATVKQQQELLIAAEKELKEKNEQKQMELSSKERMNEENNAVKLTIADISAQQKMAAEQIGFMVQRLEILLSGQDKAMDREHEKGMARDQRGHEAGMQAQQLGAQEDQMSSQQAHEAQLAKEQASQAEA